MTAPETPAETETRVESEKIDRIVGAAKPVGVHPKWRDRLDYVLVVAVILLVVGFAILWVVADHAKKEADQNAGKMGQVSSALDAANAQILKLGGTPVKTPVPSSPAITDGQILDAVAAYFADHPVASPRIDYSLLHAYVVAYLADHPARAGKNGRPGAAGPSGPPGPAGPSGSSASPEQLSAAVADYFKANPPQPGPPGPTGPSGSSVTGPPGRGITSVDCSRSSALPLDKFTFTITYSNGETQIVTCTTASPSPTP